MDILFLLIPLSVALAFLIGIAVWYAVGSGQFDDLARPALDVIADDDRPAKGACGMQHLPCGGGAMKDSFEIHQSAPAADCHS